MTQQRGGRSAIVQWLGALAVYACLMPCGVMAADQANKITIETPLFEGGAGKDFFLDCARAYEKQRPDVAVNMYLDPRIVDKVQVRILEGSFFEITNAFLNYWPLIHNGDVLELNKYLDGPNWEGDAKWRDTFLPGALDPYTENGKVYGIALPYYAFCMWYNKAMFAQHGWKPARTWEEMFDLCEKIKSAGIAPIAFQGRYPYYAQSLYDHTYYHLMGPGPWKRRAYLDKGLLDCPASVQAITNLRKLAQNYFQPGCMGMSHTESQLQFFLGKTAMIPCGSWLKSEMKGKIPDGFQLGAFNMPISSHGSIVDPGTISIYVEPFFVMSHSRHPEVAVDFLRFMTSRKMAGMFARMQDIPTAIRGANEGNLSHDLDDLLKMVESSKTSYGQIPGEGYPEMQQIFADELYKMVASFDVPPEQIAREVEKMGQDVKNRADHPEIVHYNHILEPVALLSLLAAGALIYVRRVRKDMRRAARRAARERPITAGLQKLSFGNILLFVGPALAIYSLFVIFPSLRSFSWSLHEWNGLTRMNDMPFRGLLNFKRLLFESDGFWIALDNNVFLMFMVPLFVIPISLFLAACVNRGIYGAQLFRIVFFFPNLLGGVAATLLWLHLYNPQGGLVNSFLTAIGAKSFEGFAWLEPKHLYWALIPISVWGACGFNMILYLAAMEGIPETYYEAAIIDGASPWRQFWTITIPLIWDILSISVVFLVIGGMKAFEIIWLLTNQQPQTANHVIATRMVTTMFKEYRVGEATALAVLLFLMVFVGSAATLRGLRRETVEL